MHTHHSTSDGSISKHELAQAYAHELSPKAALKRLSRWINCNPSLLRALKKHGYSVTQKKLKKVHKQIIYRYLGAP